jgi:hypothetical protein
MHWLALACLLLLLVMPSIMHSGSSGGTRQLGLGPEVLQ